MSPVDFFVWGSVVAGISGITSWLEDSARMGVLFDWKPSHSRKSIYRTTNIAPMRKERCQSILLFPVIFI
jgi:hypothetical protein